MSYKQYPFFSLKLFSLSFLCLFPLFLNAQNSFSYSAGFTLPVGDYAFSDFSSARSGGAGLGLQVGAAYQKPMKWKNFNLMAGAHVLFNPLNNRFKRSIQENYSTTSTFRYWNYFSLPLSAGLVYSRKIKDTHSVAAKAGASFTVLQLSNFVWKEEGDDDLKSMFDPANALGYFASISYALNPKNAVQLSYRQLGNFTVNGTYTYGMESGLLQDFRRQVSVLSLEYIFSLP